MIERFQKQIGLSVFITTFVLSVLAFINFNILRGYSFIETLGEPSVSVVLSAGILVLLTALIRNSITRAFQVLTFYIIGLLPGLDAVSGNLTSAIFIGFSLMLMIEYNFHRKWKILKFLIFFGVYFATVIYGFIRNGEVPLIASIHTIIGIALALYLYYIMIKVRTFYHEEVAKELEEKVSERTEQLRTEVEIKEDLLQELHHRTKNNLQLILSLLSLERDGIEGSEAHSLLDISYCRIYAVSAVQELLYLTERLTSVSVQNYINTYIPEIWELQGNPGIHIHLKNEYDFPINADKAVYLGIILNELVFGSIHRGFSGGEAGKIQIETLVDNNSFTIRYRDNSPDEIRIEDLNSQESLSLSLFESSVNQLEGKYSVTYSDGSDFRLTFPLEGLEEKPSIRLLREPEEIKNIE